jgi:hypothetical protein
MKGFFYLPQLSAFLCIFAVKCSTKSALKFTPIVEEIPVETQTYIDSNETFDGCSFSFIADSGKSSNFLERCRR